MRILVIDDSKAMRIIIKRTLAQTDRGRGATVLEAGDGAEALAMIRAEHPDLVLSDLNMPELNGIQLLEALNAEGCDVPFGFITSESTPEMHDAALAIGARFVVTKPFTPDSLGRALSEC